MSERVLLAGGAGFIGSHVADELLSRGHHVVVLDNLATSDEGNLAGCTASPRFEFIRCPVEEAPFLEADSVIHMASPASPIHYQRLSLETMSANSSGTLRLLEVAQRAGARFLFVSTSEAYGDPLQHPQSEEYWGNVNPIGPRACYDESKRFGEALTMEYSRRHGTNTAIVRLFNTYGPRMAIEDGRVIPAFAAAALTGRPLPIFGDGKQTRSFCYVSDLVAGLSHVALDPGTRGQVFNIGNPQEMTLIELARTLMEVAGGESGLEFLPPVPDDPARRRPDITRMRERFGWEPRVGLHEGLAHTIADFRERLCAPAALAARA